MFYKVVSNNIPKLYNISKAKRLELIGKYIYLYYNYTNVGGNIVFFWTDLKEDCDIIEFNSYEDAKVHFEKMEVMLK